MADGRRGDSSSSGDDPEFSWLYGKDKGSSGPTDAEPTQVMPVTPRTTTSSSGGAATQGRAARTASPPPPKRLAPEPGRTSTSSRLPRVRRPRWRTVKLVLLLWLVFLLAVPAYAWTQIEKIDAEPGGERPGEQPGTNYLLVGSDSRGDLTDEQRKELGTGGAEGQRTDTIMLLHVGSGPNLLMSIPRDSLVEVPGYGTTKINAAYAFGGPKLLTETVELNTGIRVDDYIEIGFLGLVDIVDAVGGIEICPKTQMRDKLAKLNVKRGCQEADGPTALGYARSRKLASLGDIDRAKRQREVVSSIGSEVKSPWTFINPIRYARTALAASGAFAIGDNVGPFALARFAFAMTRVDGENGLTCGVPIVDLAVTWDPERAPRMFKLIQEDRTEDVTKSLCRSTGLVNQ